MLDYPVRKHLSSDSTLEIVIDPEDIMHSTVLRHDTAESGRNET